METQRKNPRQVRVREFLAAPIELARREDGIGKMPMSWNCFCNYLLNLGLDAHRQNHKSGKDSNGFDPKR